MTPEKSADGKIEFLDIHPWLPIVLLLLLPFALHVPLWLSGWSTDAIWYFSGLTQGLHLRLGYAYIDPNAGFTTQALGHLVAWDWLHGIVPWWNQYTGVGMPLAGELQPEGFFLPFNLLLVLRQGLLWQQICMQIIAGLATYALLRELGRSRLAALMGGALYALNGTIAWTPGPSAVYCSLPFLPLLLWGIERAREQQQSAVSILAIGVAIGWSLLAGFPEPAFISGLLALAWGLYRLANEPDRWALARRAMTGFVLGLLVAAPLLISFLDYLRQSDSFAVHKSGEVSLPAAAFSMFLMPYVYGPLEVTFDSKQLSEIWGGIGGYCSILVILIATVALRWKSAHRGLKLLLLAWILIAWAKTLGVQPLMAILAHLPLLSQTAFFRYAAPSWELALIILAAFGLDDFRNSEPSRRRAFGIATGLLAMGVALAWPQRAFWSWPHVQLLTMFLYLAISLAWELAALLAAALTWTLLRGERRQMALVCLLVFDAAAMFMAPQLTAVQPIRIDTQSMRFLRDHQGLSRTYTLGPMLPNYGAYFQVASIDHNVLPVPKLWADYVDRNLVPGLLTQFQGVSFWPGYDGQGVGEQALSERLTNYLNLGVRYVITDSDRSPTPTIFVPMEDKNNPAQAPAKHGIMQKIRMPVVLAWSRSVAYNQAKPTIERLMAKAILQMNHSQATIPANRDIATPKMEYVVLESGQSAELALPAPTPPLADSPITAVGAVIRAVPGASPGNSSNAANEDLAVEICIGAECRSGQRALSGAIDNAAFQIPLDKPLVASAGAQLHITFRHQGGSRPVALRMAAAARGTDQLMEKPDGGQAARALQVAFEYGMPLQGIRKVYADWLMDIWELPNAAPYFQVIQGGPCAFLTMQREDVTTECSAPARLLRRELFMPGWRVTVNGMASKPVQQDGLFQSAALPAGDSEARYHFVPPYVGFGWVASLIGTVGLLWQVVLIGRARSSFSK